MLRISTRALHVAARGGFRSDNIARYEAHRPSYSKATLDLIFSNVETNGGAIVELGAGTGTKECGGRFNSITHQ